DDQAAEDLVHHPAGGEPLDPAADHRDRLHPLRLPPDPRAGALAAREGVRRGGGCPGRRQLARGLPRGPAERPVDGDCAAAADDRDHDPDRVGALVPVDRCAAPEGKLGDDRRGRADSALHAALGRDRAGNHDRADRAGAERLRRRPARRARPALEGEDEVTMVTFAVRRLLGLIAVMLVLSVLVFLIFFETPGVDPARLMAGRNPNQATINAIRHEFGLDRPLPVRYALMMKRMFITRDLISYGSHTRVIPE